MRKIRLAFFSDVLVRDFDGCLRTVYHIIDRIPKDRFELRFFCGTEPGSEFHYPYHTVPTVPVPMNSSYKMALPFLAKNKLKSELNDFAPDVIHITSPSPLGNYAAGYGNKNGIPVSTIYHTHFISYVDYYFRHVPALIPLARKTVVNISKGFYHKCDKVFVPTMEMIEDLSGEGINTDNMLLWPRGIDKAVFNPLKSDRTKLQSLTGNDRFNILFASRLVWEKNLKLLVKVYKLIEKKKLPYNMIIAGDGVAADELRRKMPNACFTGNVSQEELARLYASSDAFLFPSISETYGNVVIEAMACGLPCVIANGGGSRSFITHGENGYLCAPNNAEMYLNYIDKIRSDYEVRQRLKLNGFRFVRQLNWDALVDRYFSEIESLTSSVIRTKSIIAA